MSLKIYSYLEFEVNPKNIVPSTIKSDDDNNGNENKRSSHQDVDEPQISSKNIHHDEQNSHGDTRTKQVKLFYLIKLNFILYFSRKMFVHFIHIQQLKLMK